jgi:hypothetical protein
MNTHPGTTTRRSLVNIDLIADPQNNFSIIMKDGLIYKNDR